MQLAAIEEIIFILIILS